MRLLHTSDWHVGVSTRGISRKPDLEVALDELVEQAKDFRPDLILHSGDLFHQPRPQVDELELAWSGLRRLAEQAPLVVIAGNHDSAQWFEIFAQMQGKDSRIHFVGQPLSPSQGGILKFNLAGQTAKLACLPFVHANRMLPGFDQDLGSRLISYADRVMRLQKVYAEALQKGYNAHRDVLLFMAHLFVDGASLSTSERSLHVSDTYATRSSAIPPVSYAAFGHIHKPQPLPGGAPGRYAGSLIPIDFGEQNDQKHTVLVVAEPAQAAKIEYAPLTRSRCLVSLEGSKAELQQKAKEIGRVVLRLKVHLPAPDPSLSDWASSTFPQAEIVEISEQRPQAQLARPTESGPAEDLSLPEAFAQFSQDLGLAQGQPLVELLRQLEPLLPDEGAFPKLPELERL